MDVLISWSKPKSRKVATAITEWLPTVLPGIKPWMSAQSIDKGKEWFSELQGLLADAKLCIICVTDENVRSPWLYYETGAIATKKENVWVCPYLVGVNASILADGPLGKFQATVSTEADTLLLIKSLNKALAAPHDEALIAGNFAGKWPALKSQILAIEAEPPGERAEFTKSVADELAGFNLSSEARTVLIEASNSDGRVTRTRSRAGTYISANKLELAETGNPRSEALWEAALEDLVDNRLLERVGSAGSLLKLTARGYKIADKLKEMSAG
jgi:hypothetical protein